MKYFALLSCLLFMNCVKAQFYFNGDFEKLNQKSGGAEGWLTSFNPEQQKAYPVSVDSIQKHQGKYAVSIEKLREGAEFEVIDFPLVLPYPANEIRGLHVGGLLVGDGKAWFDQLEILINNQPIGEAKAKEIIVAKAIKDTVFNSSSRIEDFQLNKRRILNLTATGQFWGFLKYHHPAIAKGDYNWDAELFRLLPEVIKAQDNTTLSATLERFLSKLPIPEACKTCADSASVEVEIKPDYGMLLNGSVLSKTLTNKLLYIKENRNTGAHYYIDMAPGVGNPVFKNEQRYEKMGYPDAGYRLLSLYRYWSMINYFFPYKDIIGEDWNAVLSASIPGFVDAKNELAYGMAALKLISKVKDTHANLYGSKALNEFKGQYGAPLDAKFIENRLTVTELHTDTLDVRTKLKVGDVIEAINGVPVAKLIKQYLPITAASNEDTQMRNLPRDFLMRSQQTSMQIKVNRAGAQFDYTLPLGKANVYKNPAFDRAVPFEVMEDNIGYVFPGKYKNATLPEIKKLFANTKGIVIDMRCYPSEFMPFTFGTYLKESLTPFVKFSTGSVKDPGSFKFGPPLKNGPTGTTTDSYKGKVVVIVDASTQSQAEYTTMAFQSSPNVKVVGSTTAGADGNVSPIYLPGGLYTMISGIGVFYPDGEPTQRVGVKVDYEIKPTIEGVRAGKDELLEKAIAVVKEGE